MRTWTEEDLEEAVECSRNLTETIKRLGLRAAGGNFRSVREWIEKLQLDTSHFETQAEVAKRTIAQYMKDGKVPLEEILVENSDYSRYHLKRRLYEEGLKEPICEICGQDEVWCGRKMSLILDHINGIWNDHRLENLRIICPNCGATLETHCARNIGV